MVAKHRQLDQRDRVGDLPTSGGEPTALDAVRTLMRPFPPRAAGRLVGTSHRMESRRASAEITPYEDGPLIVRGDFRITTPDGVEIDARRRTVALCRCGLSALKPFCDGSHQAVKFRASAEGPARD